MILHRWWSSHLSVLQGSWYRPPVLSPQFEHSWYGPGKGTADNHQECQSERCRSNHTGSARRSSPWWSLSTHTHLKQRERERGVEQLRAPATQTNTCSYLTLFSFFFNACGSDTHGPQRAAFPLRRQQSALCLWPSLQPLHVLTPQPDPVKSTERKHSPQPTVESRRQLNSPRV